MVGSAAHVELALDAARQSLVLLKNDNEFLPFNPATVKKVCESVNFAVLFEERWTLRLLSHTQTSKRTDTDELPPTRTNILTIPLTHTHSHTHSHM